MVIPFLIPLVQQSEPFDDPDWLFELKYDGVRALTVIEREACRFFSQTKHEFHGYQALRQALSRDIYAEQAILDGALVVFDQLGRSISSRLRLRPQDMCYVAFDLLFLDHVDLRRVPLRKRKLTLHRILSVQSQQIFYVPHLKGSGRKLFELACELDLEGIVAKRADSPYEDTSLTPAWIEIKNPSYSQKQGHGELFSQSA